MNIRATDLATYFRVWQGFKKIDMSERGFLNSVPAFMKATVNLYREKALNNYIVIVPPAGKPDYIPDELALVALTAKESYEQIRQTSEGRIYSDQHWDLFDRNTSKSAKLIDYAVVRPKELVSQVAYDLVGEPINWAAGYNTVFIGIKKAALNSKTFLEKLRSHVDLQNSVMVQKGLKGYIFIANENYEIAYLNWESKAAHDDAKKSESGRSVFLDAENFMDVLMYQEARSFNAGDAIAQGESYSTLQR